jgi:hypothetical protein
VEVDDLDEVFDDDLDDEVLVVDEEALEVDEQGIKISN